MVFNRAFFFWSDFASDHPASLLELGEERGDSVRPADASDSPDVLEEIAAYRPAQSFIQLNSQQEGSESSQEFIEKRGYSTEEYETEQYTDPAARHTWNMEIGDMPNFRGFS